MRKRESGQAMMELTIMLLILSGMILAVVMLSGIEITSNTMLLSARNNAQKASRDEKSESYKKDMEIFDWSYTKLNLTNSYISPEKRGSFGKSSTLIKNYKISSYGDGVLQIPFSYQGSVSSNQGEASIAGATYGMTSEIFTEEKNDNYEKYAEWKRMQELDTSFNHDFSENVRSGNAFNAAKLVSAEGSSSAAPATLNRGHQAGPHSKSNAVNIMYRTFSDIFGIKVNEINLRSHETNRVYMPAL